MNTQVIFARALHPDEIEPDAFQMEGKSWFYVELSTGEGVDLLAKDIEQAKRYALEDYSDINTHH
jgi:hypothetical protein